MVDATITLYKDIGLYPDYKRTMLFDSKIQQNDWFNSISRNLKKTLTANYNKLQNSFVLHEDVGNVYQYTYVRIANLDDSGRYYYGFVSNVTLVDEENTEFMIALDPIQTFMCEWELGECLVVREHVDRWTKSSTVPDRITPNIDNVVAYMDTTIGSEAIVSNEFMINIIAITSNQKYWDNTRGVTIGTEASNRVVFLVVPVKMGRTVTNYYSKVTFSTDDGTTRKELGIPIPKLSDVIAGSVPATLGIDPDSIIGSWLIPCHNLTIYNGSATLATDESKTVDTINVFTSSATYYMHREGSTTLLPWLTNTFYAQGDNKYGAQCFNFLDLQDIFTNEAHINITSKFEKPSKPTSATTTYDEKYEPALYMEPYRKRGIVSNCISLVEIPDNVFHNGNVYLHTNLICSTTGIDNELFVTNDSDLVAVDRQEASLLGSYGRDVNIACDITTNEWLSYCLTSRKSDRDAVKSQIISNTITNMVGMGYGGALVGSRANSGRNDEMKVRGTENSRPISRAGGFGKAMVSASTFGMATGLITSAVQGWDMWNQQMGKESSIKNQPSQLSVTGDGFQYALDGNYNYRTYEMKVDENTYEIAKDNFRYYGYMVNRVEIPNIKSRYYYNYICTLNTTVKGSLSADIKQAIATIFEKGITFFHGDHCNSTEYNSYENIERAIL